MDNLCDLLKNNYIPKEEFQRVFRESETASAEIDPSWLCFEDIYREVMENTSKDTIILDLGCAYAPQCFYFKDYERYIGVNVPFGNNVRFQADNAEFYLMRIQDFIRDVLPSLSLDLDRVVAICSMVPDKEALQLVKDTFPRHYVVYPDLIETSKTFMEKEKEDYELEQ